MTDSALLELFVGEALRGAGLELHLGERSVHHKALSQPNEKREALTRAATQTSEEHTTAQRLAV